LSVRLFLAKSKIHTDFDCDYLSSEKKYTTSLAEVEANPDIGP
jgi:hypothetical protein